MKYLIPAIIGILIFVYPPGVNGQSQNVSFYIILGQSNTGWTPAGGMNPSQAAAFGGSVPNTLIWNPGVGGHSATWQPLVVGRNTRCENFADSTQFGPEASLMKSLQNQSNQQRFVYKQGQGGTTLAGDWRPPQPGQYLWEAGVRWQQLTQWLKLAASQAAASGYRLHLKGLIWMQGEDDALTYVDASRYLVNLTYFFESFDELWRDLAETYHFPRNNYKKIVGKIYAPTAYPFRDIVRAAQEAYCADPSNKTDLVNTDNYPLQDWVHYNATGQIQFGLDLFNLLGENSTLPVGFTTFAASRKNNYVQLNWLIDAPGNRFTAFEIERSHNGLEFMKIGETNTFEWVDQQPGNGANYYRVKAKGSTQMLYSKTVQVNFSSAADEFSVFPNPFAGQQLNIKVPDLPAASYNITLFSMTGKVLQTTAIRHTGGVLYTSVGVAAIPAGMYMLRLSGDQLQYAQTVFKN